MAWPGESCTLETLPVLSLWRNKPFRNYYGLYYREKKYDAKTSYFELLPAEAYLRGGLCCCFLIKSSCYNLLTYLYFSNFSISINYSYPKYDCCICLKYIHLIFDTWSISNDRNTNLLSLFAHAWRKLVHRHSTRRNSMNFLNL